MRERHFSLARGFERSDLNVRYIRGLRYKNEIEMYRAGWRGMAARVTTATGDDLWRLVGAGLALPLHHITELPAGQGEPSPYEFQGLRLGHAAPQQR